MTPTRILALAAALATGGCATLFGGGTRDDVSIDSQPDGAFVTITDQDGSIVTSGSTPQTFELKRPGLLDDLKKYVVIVTAPGYQEARVAVRKEFNGWTIANVCCLVFMEVGGAIDFLDGAAFKLRPDEIHVVLHQTPPEKAVIPGSSTRDGDDARGRAWLVFYTRGDDGQLRMASVPLVRESLVLTGR